MRAFNDFSKSGVRKLVLPMQTRLSLLEDSIYSGDSQEDLERESQSVSSPRPLVIHPHGVWGRECPWARNARAIQESCVLSRPVSKEEKQTNKNRNKNAQHSFLGGKTDTELLSSSDHMHLSTLLHMLNGMIDNMNQSSAKPDSEKPSPQKWNQNHQRSYKKKNCSRIQLTLS